MPEQAKTSVVVIVEFTTGEEEVLRLPILARKDCGEDTRYVLNVSKDITKGRLLSHVYPEMGA